jgi:hypothetical protein|tara:strand:- start:114 stop:440 length:327 start_codon:yes stop_codon:yes gene_type:complete
MNYKTKFKTLGKALAANGIDIDYMVNWASGSTVFDYTDQPRLGNGNYNGIEGWYLTKSNKDDFTTKERKVIKETLLSKGFKCKSISDFEMDIDDDRSWKPSFGFILNK